MAGAAPRENRSGSDSGFVTSLAGSLPKVQFRDVLTGGDFGDGCRGLDEKANLMGVHTYQTYQLPISCVFVYACSLGAMMSWKVRVLGICSFDPVGSLKSHTSLAFLLYLM